MIANTVTYSGILLVLGLACVSSDPQVLNPEADAFLAKMQDIIHQSSDSWLPLPTFRLNGSESGYMATVVPFHNIPVYNFTRIGDAVTNETATQIYLKITFHLNALDAEYDVFSLDNEDGACNFTVEIMSEDNNQFTLILLLDMLENSCVGKVDSFSLDTYWGMALMSPVLCGVKTRDQLIRDLTAQHQNGIRTALNTSIPKFAMQALEDFSFC
uniref:Uncharacterized protein n=1 Tax=Lygus hesperus TaxID=30085 RepID=A0A0A9Y9F6_LYGHE